MRSVGPTRGAGTTEHAAGAHESAGARVASPAPSPGWARARLYDR